MSCCVFMIYSPNYKMNIMSLLFLLGKFEDQLVSVFKENQDLLENNSAEYKCRAVQCVKIWYKFSRKVSVTWRSQLIAKQIVMSRFICPVEQSLLLVSLVFHSTVLVFFQFSQLYFLFSYTQVILLGTGGDPILFSQVFSCAFLVFYCVVYILLV